MVQGRVAAVAVGLVIVAVAVGGGLFWQRSYTKSQAPEQSTYKQPTNVKEETPVQPNQLQVTDEKVGNGAEAVAGKKVSVHYTGTLQNGTKFDSSVDRGQPFEFTLGSGQVIKGWDQGVAGMKVGGKRKLVIPADLAYGSQSPSPSIPPNSTLLFDIELLAVN